MIKLSKEEFLEELIGEMEGYEDITEEYKKLLVDRINVYIEKESDQNKRISKKANSIMIKFEDETQIFEIVDKYLSAIINEEMGKYWEGWKF